MNCLEFRQRERAPGWTLLRRTEALREEELLEEEGATEGAAFGGLGGVPGVQLGGALLPWPSRSPPSRSLSDFCSESVAEGSRRGSGEETAEEDEGPDARGKP